jgi:hypothetical protein
MMEINLAAPSLSTWKLNNPRVISKPPVLAEVDPIKHEMGSTTVVTGRSMANTGADSMIIGEAVSMSFGVVMPMMVGDAVSMSMSMSDDALSMSMVFGDAESRRLLVMSRRSLSMRADQ